MNPFPGLLFDAVSLRSHVRVVVCRDFAQSTATVYYGNHQSMRFYRFDDAVDFATRAVQS